MELAYHHQVPAAGCHLLEPVQQLEPYLRDFDVADAVESFEKLADSLMISAPCLEFAPGKSELAGCKSAWQWSLDETSASSSSSSSSPPSPSNNSQWLSSSSSSSSSSTARSSPALSERTFSTYCACSSPGGASESSSKSFSSSLTSGSSQFGSGSSSSSRRFSSRWNNRGTVHQTGNRRKKNASAAEKYRRKLKGRELSLAEQMELEQERNGKLRGQVEAKLVLYKEFVSLLARNTGRSDLELAQLGKRSLTTVLETKIAEHLDEGARKELQAQLEQFEQILISREQQQQQQQAAVPVSVGGEHNSLARASLVYNFYTDTYVAGPQHDDYNSSNW